MKVIFVGTSDFAIPSLNKLLDSGYNVLAVVAQPDRPKGRGKSLQAPPIKQIALDRSIPVLQPVKINTPEAIAEIKVFGEIDALVVAAYGQKIPKELLDYPRLGPINVHGSILPKYRGAAPIQYSLLNGDEETGVTTMFMAEGLDTGDILLQEKLEIKPDETAGELSERLAILGAGLLIKTLEGLKNGAISPVPQDNSKATLAPSLPPDAGKLNWEENAQKNINIYRGCTPKPGAYTFINGAKLKIWSAKLCDSEKLGTPGEIINIAKDGFEVATPQGSIFITEVQPESRKRMNAGDFVRGSRICVGEKLGQ